ncbi:MAG: lipoprotein-releasing ABC transporter permease subunit [Sphingomonadales bacterium]
MKGYEWLIARRYLLPSKGEGFVFLVSALSFLGIAIGVAALITVMSVMNGFREELFERILGVNGHAVIQGYGGQVFDYEKVAEEALAQKSVIRATPLIEKQVMTSYQSRTAGAIVRGIRQEDLAALPLVGQNIVHGSLDDFSGDNAAAVGSRLAANLGLKVGDDITIISPQGTTTPFGTAPRFVSYQVTAIFEVGIYNFDNAFVYLPLEAAQTYFRLGDSVSGIELQVEDPDRVEEAYLPLIDLIRTVGGVSDWRQTNRELYEALVLERNVMFIILTIIIFVAAFNIISSLVMLVRFKSRDIAILRTMGASRRSMMRVFIVAGGTIGTAGTLAGLGLGLALTLNLNSLQKFLTATTGANLWDPSVRFLTELPSKIDPTEVTIVVLLALGLTILATLYPSWRASRTDPVQVLRYE